MAGDAAHCRRRKWVWGKLVTKTSKQGRLGRAIACFLKIKSFWNKMMFFLAATLRTLSWLGYWKLESIFFLCKFFFGGGLSDVIGPSWSPICEGCVHWCHCGMLCSSQVWWLFLLVSACYHGIMIDISTSPPDFVRDVEESSPPMKLQEVISYNLKIGYHSVYIYMWYMFKEFEWHWNRWNDDSTYPGWWMSLRDGSHP